MCILIFDLEITGLPSTRGFMNYYPYSELQYYESSRIVELAYIITDREGNILHSYENIIRPCNYTITNDKIHHITQDMAMQQGIPLSDALSTMAADIQSHEITKILSYNVLFDKNVLFSEIHRMYGSISESFNKKYECIMELWKINDRYIALNKLYNGLYPPIVQEHRAMTDCVMAYRVYFHSGRKYTI